MKQNYDKNIIEGLFHQYFPEKEIIQYSLCEGGVENSNFLIETEQGKYILKVFESSRHDEEIIRSEVEIMIETKKRGVCVPEIFHTQKENKTIIPGPGGKLTILMEYIDGLKYRDISLSSDLFLLMGKRVAQFHQNLDNLEKKYLVPETHIFDIKYIFEHAELQKFIPDYADHNFLKKIWADLAKVQGNFLSLPRQIVHNDLNSNNVIFKESDPYFIDFSDMVVGTCIQDIAIALVTWCFHHHWNPSGMSDFILGYESIRLLSSEEKKCLFACIEARMLNILMIPYLDADIGDYDELKEYIGEYYQSLKKFHEFGEEDFQKIIP